MSEVADKALERIKRRIAERNDPRFDGMSFAFERAVARIEHGATMHAIVVTMGYTASTGRFYHVRDLWKDDIDDAHLDLAIDAFGKIAERSRKTHP